MPFIGFNFDKIEAVRSKEDLKGNINVKHNLNITEIKKEEITVDKSQEVLKFFFEFRLEYEPGVGNVNLFGNLTFIEESKKMKDILQDWKKDKKIPQEIMQPLFNTILAKSNIKALSLCQDINLPPHIPLPKLQPVKNKYNEYIG